MITDLIGIELPIDPSWPLGLISAVLAAALLWPVGARLGLSPASRATAAAIYATAAVLVEAFDPVGTDGRATLVEITAAGRAVALQATERLNAEVFGQPGLPQRRLQSLLTGLGELRRSAGDLRSPSG